MVMQLLLCHSNLAPHLMLRPRTDCEYWKMRACEVH